MPDFDEGQLAWDRIADEVVHPFALPDWLEPWWNAFGREGALRLYACYSRDSGEPIALVPLFRDAGGLVKFVGDGLSDQLGPVVSVAKNRHARAALTAALQAELGPGDRFVGTSLPVLEGWPEYAGARLRSIEPSPIVVTRGTTWQTYLAGERGRQRRKTVQACDRLLDAGDVEIEEILAPEEVSRGLAILFDLHAARWGERSSVFSDSKRAFFLETSAALAGRGALCIRVATVDGTAAAAMYCFRWARAEWFYQSGWDPRFRALGVGSALLAYSIRRAFESLTTFRFLRGGEPYKRRWATADDPVATIEIAGSAP